MAKIKIVCSECGSDDVRRDAYAAWDVASQEWELCCVFDQGYCEQCGGEASLDEVPADEGLVMEKELIEALRELQKQLRAHVRLDVRKHYSLMVADAAANTVIAKAEGKA